MMKSTTLCIALAFVLTLSSACQTDVETKATATHVDAAGTTAPDSIRLLDYRGQWLVINYWAEWCAPCRTEIPELNLLALHDPERIAVVGVNFDGISGDELNRVATALGIEFPNIIQDPAAKFGYRPPQVLPSTYIFDPSGQLTHQLQGPQSFEQLLELTLMLAGPKTPARVK
jgi:thiol-disulfide isomerase/thioredoxin